MTCLSPSARALRAALGLAAILAASGPAADALGAEEGGGEEEEVDHVALAAVLVKDGHYDRAAAVLAEVDPEREGVDLPRYYTLYGLVSLKNGDYAGAEERFERALEHGQTDEMIWVFLAQARFGQQDFEGTIEALDHAGAAAESLPGTYLMRAQCHWRLDDRFSAFEALSDGIDRHPENMELRRHRVLLLVDMGLFHTAAEEGLAYLECAEATADDHVAIAEALIRGGEADEAILILEVAHLRYPENEAILVQLARAYMETDRTLTAARIFRDAARRNPRFALDAAELYRRAGRLVQALYLHAAVQDQTAKTRQRLGILIELERYEEAVALAPRLSRLGLMEEDSVTYAVAYALFQTSRFEEAERYLKMIDDPELFERASELRRAMDTCAAAGWECQ